MLPQRNKLYGITVIFRWAGSPAINNIQDNADGAPALDIFFTTEPSQVNSLRNLTDNAAQYTPARGVLVIDIDTDPQYLRVTYRNSVDNAKSEDLPYLFERFYR